LHVMDIALVSVGTCGIDTTTTRLLKLGGQVAAVCQCNDAALPYTGFITPPWSLRSIKMSTLPYGRISLETPRAQRLSICSHCAERI
jgi:hypothetical protein